MWLLSAASVLLSSAAYSSSSRDEPPPDLTSPSSFLSASEMDPDDPPYGFQQEPAGTSGRRMPPLSLGPGLSLDQVKVEPFSPWMGGFAPHWMFYRGYGSKEGLVRGKGEERVLA